MGIFCEINLFKPADGAFTPGSTVAGTIKYSIDEETVFKTITISLKGNGHLSMDESRGSKKGMTLRNHEEYVNICNVAHSDEKGQKAVPVGSYETQFSFKLPEKIPSTLHCLKNQPRYVIRCNIAYYIRIKFEKQCFMSFDKKFKKEITVISGITPRLPTVPTVCGEQKSLTQFFSRNKSIVHIKATIKSCVVRPGARIEFDYEVTNDTNIIIKGVETKLVEKYIFTSKGGREVPAIEEIKNTDSKTGSIQIGESKTMTMEIEVPSELNSLDYSKIVSKDYAVRIIAGLPMPHRDAVLEIPVQIGEVDFEMKTGDAPPTYWEAMGEDDKSNDSKYDEKDKVDFEEKEKS